VGGLTKVSGRVRATLVVLAACVVTVGLGAARARADESHRDAQAALTDTVGQRADAVQRDSLRIVPARDNWLQPDGSLRDAQFALQVALRDTVGHLDDAARLDSLGIALLRLGREADAETVLRRVLTLAPSDDAARAGLGKLALFHDRTAEAESLLAASAHGDPAILADLLAVYVRRGEWKAAAAIATDADQPGRAPLFERLDQGGAYSITGPDEVKLLMSRVLPVPLVRVKLNGQTLLFAVDFGASDLLVDQSVARRCNVQFMGGRSLVFWNGSRVAARAALVQRLEIGGLRIERIPAAAIAMRRYSIVVNPQSEQVAGVIGFNLLRHFTPTIDFKHGRIELHRLGHALIPPDGASRVRFEIWGESEMTVWGLLGAGRRRMAMVVQNGLPGCAVGAPQVVFNEIGVKPGGIAKVMRGAGSVLAGQSWVECGVPSIAVGPIADSGVRGGSGALDAGELWRHGVRRDAVLASEFFRAYRVTIDWEKHELIFEED
jgi:hypothetical protein